MVQSLQLRLYDGAQRGVPCVVNTLHKWLVSIFWKSPETTNSQIRTIVVQKSIYTVTGNDVIGHVQWATNSVNDTGTTASFSVRKYFFLSIISENAAAGNFKIYHRVTAFTSQLRTVPPATSVR